MCELSKIIYIYIHKSSPYLFFAEGTKLVVNYDKAFTNGTFLDTAFGAYESAVMGLKEKILQPSNQEAAASIASNNNEVGKDGSVTYP
jgi:hypothetical protein